MRAASFYKETSEDWCPSFETKQNTKLLKVSCNIADPRNNTFVVSVSGADDMLMQRIFKNEDDARMMMHTLATYHVGLTQETLKEMGFTA